MNVEQIMQTQVRSCRPSDSAQVAALAMRDADCGVLPVTTDEEALVGIVTDRDLLLKAAEKALPLSEITVEDAMSSQSYVCLAEDDVRVVERLMCRHQVRRIPVVDPGGHVVGIVSLSDLARVQTAQPTGDTSPDRQVVAATFEAIVRP
jgi:CBS domain-containing protein